MNIPSSIGPEQSTQNTKVIFKQIIQKQNKSLHQQQIYLDTIASQNQGKPLG